MTIVRVYTMPSCPGCNATKKRLDNLGIPPTSRNPSTTTCAPQQSNST